MIRCPECGKRRARTSTRESDTCTQCEVRRELRRGQFETDVSAWMDRSVSGVDPGPFPAGAAQQGVTREWIAGHIDRAHARHSNQASEPGPPDRRSWRDRLLSRHSDQAAEPGPPDRRSWRDRLWS